MKRVKSYNLFREDRPIKEEFISKLWRNITGEKDVKIVGNQFILKKWQAKGEKTK